MSELKFVNSDATPKTVVVSVARKSIPTVMAWYGGYHCGDRYAVYVDGAKVAKDQNGEPVGKLPTPPAKGE